MATNFNRWLSDKSTQGNLRFQNCQFQNLPLFISGLKYDCTELDVRFNNINSITNVVCALDDLKYLDVSHNLLGYVDVEVTW